MIFFFNYYQEVLKIYLNFIFATKIKSQCKGNCISNYYRCIINNNSVDHPQKHTSNKSKHPN